MKKYLFNIFLILLFTNLHLENCHKNKIRKNILIIIFPGGQHKNIYMKTLFDFSLNNNDEYDFYFDIVIHESETKLWKNSLNKDKNKNKYKIHSYGSISDGIEKYDIDDLPKQNLFKFYQLKLRLYNQDFLDSEIITSLKSSKIKYSLLITDRPNYIAVLCAKELLIHNKMYLSLRPFPQLFDKEKSFLNPSFIPSLGSEFTNLLTFKERCTNFYNYVSDRILNFLSNYEIKYLYNVYDYPYINTNNYFYDNTIILIQYPMIITYPLSLPPHIIPINPIALPYNYNLNNIENDLNLKEINTFMNNYINNIILSKEILHQMKEDILSKIIIEMKVIGFIYVYDNEEKKFENKIKNLFSLDYKKYGFESYEKVLYYLLNKNDVCGIITNSNFNEILISVYYSKPIISFGNGIYQQNINSYIKKNNIGVIINRNNINEYSSFIEAIKKIKKDNEYTSFVDPIKIIKRDDEEELYETNNVYVKNCKKLSKILKLNYNNHPGEEFIKWLKFGIKNEYNNLKIHFYEQHNSFVINNYDIIIISLIIITIFFYLVILFCKKIFCNCCNCCSYFPFNKNKKEYGKNKIKKE